MLDIVKIYTPELEVGYALPAWIGRGWRPLLLYRVFASVSRMK
ncbi:MAG: hypothetical protein ACJA09_002656 [Alcanivorax sp.]|jgi:hypothetical protein